MPIYFRNTPVTMPFMFDSVGNHWYQESMQRPNGHPHYHYLQTEMDVDELRSVENIISWRNRKES